MFGTKEQKQTTQTMKIINNNNSNRKKTINQTLNTINKKNNHAQQKYHLKTNLKVIKKN
jgi:hypothetical protein